MQSSFDSFGGNLVVCVDNYGQAHFQCEFTKKILPGYSLKQVGRILRQAPGYNLMEDSDEARSQRKVEVSAFDDMDQNCNACGNLVRSHVKAKSFELREGTCDLTKEVVKYHPDDFMGKSCFTNRRTTA